MKKCYCDGCKKRVDEYELEYLKLFDGITIIHREFCELCASKIRTFFKWKFLENDKDEVRK